MTKQEEEKIREMALVGAPCKEVANALGKHYSTIKRYLNNHNLPSNPPKKGIQINDYKPIFDLYMKNLTIQEIHDNYYPNYTTDQINYILREEGITRRNGKQVVLNHSYFKEINSKQKAYWLGLLLADGNLQHLEDRGNCWRITLELMSDDKYLVEKFRNDVQSNLNVKTYINHSGFQKKDGKPHETSKLVLHSSEMASDLLKYGMIPQKSDNLTKLPSIDDSYMGAFLLGYFDGNGSVTFDSKNKSLKKIVFYSSHDFCESIKNYLYNQLGLPLNKVVDQKDAKVSLLTYGCQDDVIRLRDYMYDQMDTCLIRKKEKLFK